MAPQRQYYKTCKIVSTCQLNTFCIILYLHQENMLMESMHLNPIILNIGNVNTYWWVIKKRHHFQKRNMKQQKQQTTEKWPFITQEKPKKPPYQFVISHHVPAFLFGGLQLFFSSVNDGLFKLKFMFTFPVFIFDSVHLHGNLMQMLDYLKYVELTYGMLLCTMQSCENSMNPALIILYMV